MRSSMVCQIIDEVYLTCVVTNVLPTSTGVLDEKEGIAALWQGPAHPDMHVTRFNMSR